MSTRTEREEVIKDAKKRACELMRGDRSTNEIGLGPTPATATAMNELKIDRRDPRRAQVFAYVLGFHDTLMRDGGGYKVPNAVGKDYEEGHRAGAELMSQEKEREKILCAPREAQ